MEKVEFNISEDTALMIDKMNNPYMEFDPNYFNEDQKQKWLKNFELN